MGKSNRGRGLVIILAITLPMLIVGLQSATTPPSLWVVFAGERDENINIAAQMFEQDILTLGGSLGEKKIDEMGTLPLNADAIVLIGHGTPEGLLIDKDILLWSEVIGLLEERKPKTVFLLACNSPSNPETNFFGFVGQIDAEAGALLAAWHIKRALGADSEVDFPFERISEAQGAMRNPLGSYVYFVHGFHGSNEQFEDMTSTLFEWGTFADYDGYSYFDYFDDYSSPTIAHGASIEEFANNFASMLLNAHPAGTQIDIVAHSMGGLIVRQMLMASRQTLESYGLEVSRVITLGTPHDGTSIAEYGLGPLFVNIMDAFYNPEPWISDVFAQMAPSNDFITTLNANPASYSSGIDWYTFSAISNSGWAILMLPVHLGPNDVPVASGRAHLSFATQLEPFAGMEHNQLIEDSQKRTYSDISTFLAGGIDSDGDGLLDVEERRVYGTDEYDPDSDNDGLTDYEEVVTYLTNPNYWNTDGDAIGDANEVAWGYNPTNSNDPISAASLIDEVQYTFSTMYVKVYVNHYSNMDYVKFYVKYKTKTGSWTSYYYMGTDYTPSSGLYYDSWTHGSGYAKMTVKVNAYDSSGHYLGSDTFTRTINMGSGGGPPPPPIE